ncbi:MAG: hypothetical protein FIB04_08970 [Gammaproteobacteria bacterium]|nr:hypothetical protein [Gammaproteobacteria bacterium]
MNTRNAGTDALTLKERARRELIRYLEVSGYLFVAFAVLIFYRNALLSEEGVSGLSLGFAAGKALILGKFLLLGESAGVGKRFRASTLWVAILRQAILMWVLLLVLSVIEESLVGLAHGHSLSQTLADYEAHSVVVLFSKSLVLLVVLLPLIATTEIGKALGPGVLRELLLSEEREREDSRKRSL